MAKWHPPRIGLKRSFQGFTLVEMALVLVIIGFAVSGGMLAFNSANASRQESATKKQLEFARQLVLTFAITNKRLPCPARSAPTSTIAAGFEVIDGTGQCIGDGVEDYYGGTLTGGITGGLLPGRSIGFPDVDSDGFAIDAYGNRIRYAISKPSAGHPGSLR
jgi:prepilin-type N-terminal cleavage/methylation domain-containing protein